ncbi:MAG: ribbon-helix-helix protein, CopG family [Bradymonadales bacterium]|nr:ribbon-helix-helix protein, CopG family [Bradymonadales bacterium]
MRTTLTLDEDVAARLTELAGRSGKSFKALVNEMLRRGMAIREETATLEPFVVHTRPLMLRKGVTIDNIGELLEQIEGPAHS